MSLLSEISINSGKLPPPVAVFSHGKESGPYGEKMMALSEVAEICGLRTLHPDYRGIDNPVKRVRHLLDTIYDIDGPFVFVGSSMGGYVSIRASRQRRTNGLFLMAPAIGITTYPYNKSASGCKGKDMVIVHAWKDEVVPVQPVIEYASAFGAQLHLVNSDHRLTGQIPLLCALFSEFLKPLVVA